jgi:5-methylcytosine-specific restriction endonuclease McrA
MELKKQTKKELKKIEKREIKKKDLEWRDKVKKRDNNCCVYSGSRVFLDCHHLISRKNFRLRWDIDNGIVLRKKFHKFNKEFSAHGNPFVFMLWFMENRSEQYERLKKKYLGYTIK